MRKLKLMGIIILILSLLLFVLQNREPVDIKIFAGWGFDGVPLILVMVLNVLLGLLIGIYIARNVGKDKKPRGDRAKANAKANADDADNADKVTAKQ